MIGRKMNGYPLDIAMPDLLAETVSAGSLSKSPRIKALPCHPQIKRTGTRLVVHSDGRARSVWCVAKSQPGRCDFRSQTEAIPFPLDHKRRIRVRTFKQARAGRTGGRCQAEPHSISEQNKNKHVER